LGNSKIKDSILDVVGNTPLVRCGKISGSEGIVCNLLAKCEFMNPGGAVKDRIGRRMLVDALNTGEWDGRKFKPGDVLIEPTSGNTGIGLSIAAAVKGFDMVITMPEKMSQEKQDALKGLGATIVRTPTEYAWDHEGSHISEAYKLREKLNKQFEAEGSTKAAHVLDQYRNPGNPMAHYEETGQEIWDQTEGKITHLIAGAGTGGTISGIARRLKELNPDIVVVGVDPNGSILARPEKMNDENPAGPLGQQTEGIGYDFIPRVLDHNVIDEWLKGPDKESFIMARRLLREEGFMCGGSSGTAMDAAVRYCKMKNLGPEATVVVVLPDNIRNYMTKHLNADWMYERGYMTEEECMETFAPKHIENKDWGQDMTVADLDLHPAYFLRNSTTCKEAIDLMRAKGFDQFPVKEEDGNIYGVLTATNLLTRLGKNQLQLTDPIKRAVVRDLRHVSLGVPLNELVRILNRNSFVLIDNQFFVTFSDVFDVMMQSQEGPSVKAQIASMQQQIDELKAQLAAK
jgi:cystathionine beta-synthase